MMPWCIQTSTFRAEPLGKVNGNFRVNPRALVEALGIALFGDHSIVKRELAASLESAGYAQPLYPYRGGNNR